MCWEESLTVRQSYAAGWGKVATGTREGDGGVKKKSFPQVFLPNSLQQSMLLQSVLNPAW